MNFERILAFCAALDNNNNREWFHENHKFYEEAKGDFISLLESLRFAIGENAPTVGRDVALMQAKDWMYRVARDMRFYRDRPPYDPALRAYICTDRKSWRPIGYYIRIFPGSSCFGAGLWCMETADVNKVRRYISSHYSEFESAHNKSGLALTGDKLKKLPRGFDEDDPAGELLKYKNWEYIVNLPDEALTDFDSFSELIGSYVKRMEPMREFLYEASAVRAE